MIKVFLGGTCNNSTWRDDFAKKLTIDYFNPVVKDWTPEVQEEELKQREECDYCLYTITPKMTGVYSIAEVVDDSNKRPEKTLFCFISQDGENKFTEAQSKSLRAVAKMVDANGGKCFDNLSDTLAFLNDTSKRPVNENKIKLRDLL